MDTTTPNASECARCGDDIGPGSALYSDRVQAADGRMLCRECALREQGRNAAEATPDVPITMPNTNLPQSH
jgi:recombinational DNA repair protein (RecF pathway)